MMELKPDERAWVRRKWDLIRKSQMIADKSNNEWNALNSSINEKLDGDGVYDIVQRDRIKGASLALKNALETGKWHSANAQRHIDDLQLFLRMKELELL